jgi:hypothetical protein
LVQVEDGNLLQTNGGVIVGTDFVYGTPILNFQNVTELAITSTLIPWVTKQSMQCTLSTLKVSFFGKKFLLWKFPLGVRVHHADGESA